jgi:hypothetical protein
MMIACIFDAPADVSLTTATTPDKTLAMVGKVAGFPE